MAVSVQFELGSSLSKMFLAFSLVFDLFLFPQKILETQKAAWKTFMYFKRNHHFKKTYVEGKKINPNNAKPR